MYQILYGKLARINQLIVSLVIVGNNQLSAVYVLFSNLTESYDSSACHQPIFMLGNHLNAILFCLSSMSYPDTFFEFIYHILA